MSAFCKGKGALHVCSYSSLNLGQLAKRIRCESDELNEEDSLEDQRKNRQRRAKFDLESPNGFTFT